MELYFDRVIPRPCVLLAHTQSLLQDDDDEQLNEQKLELSIFIARNINTEDLWMKFFYWIKLKLRCKQWMMTSQDDSCKHYGRREC